MKFLTSLLQKTVASFFPVINDSFFTFIIRADDPSISNHRSVLQNLQSTALIEDHSVIFRNTHFFHVTFVISYFTKNVTLFKYISGFFEGIPKTVFFCCLIAEICHIQRIIGTKILLSQINSQMTENIPHISSCGTCLLVSPFTHSASFNKNTWDSLRSCVVIGTAGCYIRFYHIRYIHLFCHSSGFCHSFFRRNPCIINIWCQSLIIISTVKINIVICYRLQFS